MPEMWKSVISVIRLESVRSWLPKKSAVISCPWIVSLNLNWLAEALETIAVAENNPIAITPKVVFVLAFKCFIFFLCNGGFISPIWHFKVLWKKIMAPRACVWFSLYVGTETAALSLGLRYAKCVILLMTGMTDSSV